MIALAALLLFVQATGSTITGTITDSVTHKPVNHALVSAPDGTRDVTGADGTYTLKGLPAGNVKLRIASSGYRPFDTTVQLAQSDFQRCDFELHPMARFTGKLNDKETGEPIRRTVLLFATKNGRGGGRVDPDKDGSFTLDNLASGDYTLHVDGITDSVVRFDADTVIGFNRAEKPDPKKARQAYGDFAYPDPIHLEEGEQRTLEIRLPALETYRVSGKIAMPGGHDSDPLSLGIQHNNFVVTTESPVRHPESFSVEGLTRGEYIFTARVGDGSNALYGNISFRITDHDITDMRLSMAPPASLTGVVRMAEDDAVLPGDMVFLLMTQTAAGRAFIPMPADVKEGRFHMDAIPPGDYWPLLDGLPRNYALIEESHAMALYGAREITFVVTSKAATIIADVRDKDGAPVRGANVEIVPDLPAGTSPMQRGMSNPNLSELTFSGMSPGRYLVNGVPVEVGLGQTVRVAVGAGKPGAER